MNFDVLTARPWLLTDDALQTMLAIVGREQNDKELAALLNEQRRAFLEPQGDTPPGASYTTVQDGIATIEVIGPIFRRANLFTQYSGGTSTDLLSADVQRAVNDPAIRGIVMAFDSPGGDANGIHELASAIRAGTDQKPIVAYVGGMAASAAYWLASACSEIVADATAELGSIGAVLALPNPNARSSREIEIVSSQSPKKRPDVTTESGRAQYQARVDALAAEFVADVASNRKVSEDTVLSDFGQGGVMSGRAAVAAKLADRLGSLQDTRAALSRRTNPLSFRRGMAATQEQDMKLQDFFRSAFTAASEAGIPLEPDDATMDAQISAAAHQPNDQATAELEAMRARLAAYEQEQRDAAEQALTAQATAFAEGLVKAEQFLPAQASDLEAVYKACHAAGCVAHLEAMTSAQPAVVRTGEVIAVQDGAQVVQLDAAPQQSAAERAEARRRRLALTPEGRAVLAAEHAAHT